VPSSIRTNCIREFSFPGSSEWNFEFYKNYAEGHYLMSPDVVQNLYLVFKDDKVVIARAQKTGPFAQTEDTKWFDETGILNPQPKVRPPAKDEKIVTEITCGMNMAGYLDEVKHRLQKIAPTLTQKCRDLTIKISVKRNGEASIVVAKSSGIAALDRQVLAIFQSAPLPPTHTVFLRPEFNYKVMELLK
jgi:hypothetical protein